MKALTIGLVESLLNDKDKKQNVDGLVKHRCAEHECPGRWREKSEKGNWS